MKIEETGLKETLKWLSDKEKTHVPAAAMKAVNATANIAREAVYDEMRKVFDRPTPYTMRSVWINKAVKERLSAEVYIFNEWVGKGTSPIKFLWPEVEGGRRNQKPFETLLSNAGIIGKNQFLMPWKAPLNQYGNVTPGTIQKVLSGLQAGRDATQDSPLPGDGYKGTRANRKVAKRYFTTKDFGNVVIWEINESTKKRVPLFVSTNRATYKRRLRFVEIVNETVDRFLVTEFLRALYGQN